VNSTVLVCDDAVFMRTMIGDILTQAGLDVVGEAESGTEAVAKYKELRPDLVTMDIIMPEMGGIDAVRAITEYDPQARVLMCSAMGQQALVAEAIQAGAGTPHVPAQDVAVLVEGVSGKEPVGLVPEGGEADVRDGLPDHPREKRLHGLQRNIRLGIWLPHPFLLRRLLTARPRG